jgi:hypothetical protein
MDCVLAQKTEGSQKSGSSTVGTVGEARKSGTELTDLTDGRKRNLCSKFRAQNSRRFCGTVKTVLSVAAGARISRKWPTLKNRLYGEKYGASSDRSMGDGQMEFGSGALPPSPLTKGGCGG